MKLKSEVVLDFCDNWRLKKYIKDGKPKEFLKEFRLRPSANSAVKDFGTILGAILLGRQTPEHAGD